jgi:hypothetical protein
MTVISLDPDTLGKWRRRRRLSVLFIAISLIGILVFWWYQNFVFVLLFSFLLECSFFHTILYSYYDSIFIRFIMKRIDYIYIGCAAIGVILAFVTTTADRDRYFAAVQNLGVPRTHEELRNYLQTEAVGNAICQNDVWLDVAGTRDFCDW